MLPLPLETSRAFLEMKGRQLLRQGSWKFVSKLCLFFSLPKWLSWSQRILMIKCLCPWRLSTFGISLSVVVTNLPKENEAVIGRLLKVSRKRAGLHTYHCLCRRPRPAEISLCPLGASSSLLIPRVESK